MKNIAADIGAFLQQVSGPAALFGHSLGGIVAIMTAALYPQVVRALLVGDAPLDAVTWQARMQGQRETQQHWRELSGGKFTVEEIMTGLKQTPMDTLGPKGLPKTFGEIYPDGDPIYEHLALRLIDHDPDVLGMILEDYARVAAGYDMDKLLPAIRCPVLLMQADPDAGSAMTDAEATQALKLLKHGHHVKFTGLSHRLFVDDLKWVASEMDKFLRLIVGD